MLDLAEFFSIQQRLLRHTLSKHRRFLYERIDWSERLLGLVGGRGTGKTTLLLQHLSGQGTPEGEILYLSADHILVEALGLYEIGRDFFQGGGRLLVVDEIHKSQDWARRIKNLYDAFPSARIVFSGSSALKPQLGKADLSRRAVYYTLPTLSLREYLLLDTGIEHQSFTLTDLLQNHARLAAEILKSGPVLGHFKAFLDHGAYPFFTEGADNYHSRLRNVVEKILYEDIPPTTGMRYTGVPVLKKILFQIASSPPFQLNIERLASDLGITKPTLYSYLTHLETAGLIAGVMPEGSGATLTRKPAKLFLENTNLQKTIGSELRLEDPLGTVRETFFAGQLRNAGHKVRAARQGDFIVDDQHLFEVGGRKKSAKQLAGRKNALIVKDDIETGSKNVLPLWLFGFLY